MNQSFHKKRFSHKNNINNSKGKKIKCNQVITLSNIKMKKNVKNDQTMYDSVPYNTTKVKLQFYNFRENTLHEMNYLLD